MSSVLVVDDSPSTVCMLREVLEEVGIEVLSAGCGAEALQVIASRHPDVVILDIVLPDQSGLASFERIQQLDSTIPVIFITALGTSDTAIEAMRLGAARLPAKTVGP